MRMFSEAGEFVTHTRLDNGIEVVTDRSNGAGTLAVYIGFRAGSCDETDVPNGTAHVLEHMVFRGTEQRTAEEIQHQIVGEGGNLNAETDWDSTVFTCESVPGNLTEVLSVLSDILMRPKLAADTFELERSIILEELEQGRGGWSTMMESLFVAAYGEQSVTRPIVGSEESIHAVNVEDVRRFFEENYVSGNMVAVAAGNVAHEEFADRVAEAFSGMRAGIRRPTPRLDYIGGEQNNACSCDRGAYLQGFDTPPYLHPDRLSTQLFQELVAGGPLSRLFAELREKRGLVYGVSEFEYEFCGRALSTIDVQTSAAKLREVYKIADDALWSATENITAQELDRVKRVKLARVAMLRDDMNRRAKGSMFELLSCGRLQPWKEFERHVIEATIDDVQSAGRRMLMSQPALAVHGNARTMPRLKDRRSSERAAAA